MKIKHPSIRTITFPPHCEWVTGWDTDEIIIFGLTGESEGTVRDYSYALYY